MSIDNTTSRRISWQTETVASDGDRAYLLHMQDRDTTSTVDRPWSLQYFLNYSVNKIYIDCIIIALLFSGQIACVIDYKPCRLTPLTSRVVDLSNILWFSSCHILPPPKYSQTDTISIPLYLKSVEKNLANSSFGDGRITVCFKSPSVALLLEGNLTKLRFQFLANI